VNLRGKARKLLYTGIVVVVATTALGIASPASAHDESSYCTVTFTSCTTGSIHSSGWGYHIHIAVMGGVACGADFRLVDAVNGITVYTGHTGTGWTNKNVFGLYSRYYLRVYNTCWDAEGQINNYTL
jgi:hypothetical protein